MHPYSLSVQSALALPIPGRTQASHTMVSTTVADRLVCMADRLRVPCYDAPPPGPAACASRSIVSARRRAGMQSTRRSCAAHVQRSSSGSYSSATSLQRGDH